MLEVIGFLVCVSGLSVVIAGFRKPLVKYRYWRLRVQEYERRFQDECVLETDAKRENDDDPNLKPFEQWSKGFEWPLEWRADD